MNQALVLQRIKKSYLGTILKKVLFPVLPGWVDEGRKIVQGPHLRKLLEHATATPARVENILNAGAGEGLYSFLLLAVPGVKQVLELDADYLRYARNAHSPKQRFLAASLTNVPLRDKTVDLILCSEVLEHIHADDTAISELARVLSPGGWLLISVPTPPALFDPAHVREGYSLDDLSKSLVRNGLEIIAVRFCMYAMFQLFLKRYRQGWVPRIMIYILSWSDGAFPLGRPMDLIILARCPTVS